MMRFSSTEKRDLIKAWVVISLAVSIASLGLEGISALGLPLLLRIVVANGLTVGVALLAHEVMGHKFLAQQYYRLFAEFRADDLFLLFALLTSFSGFVFVAPGAVVIAGVTRIDTFGKIAAAGPLVNIVLAIVFGALYHAGIDLVLPLYQNQGLDLVLRGYQINSWFALFNMLPLSVWDGAKVMAWDRKVWFALTALAALLFFGII